MCFFSKNKRRKKIPGPKTPNVNIINPTVINLKGTKINIIAVLIMLEKLRYRLALINCLPAFKGLLA